VPVISGLGIIFNTWCVAVFAMIARRKDNSPNSHMFKYLLLKAVHDDVQFLIQIFAPLYYCTGCLTYQTYASQVWYIWFYYYVECINELCSGFYEVAATLDCLLTINQKLECCKKNLVFYIVSVSVFAFAALFYTFFLFNFTIVKYTRVIGDYQNKTTGVVNQTVQQFYVYEYSEFSTSSANIILKRAHGVLRDVVTLVVLVILNVMIMLTVRQSVNSRRRLTNNNTNASARNVTIMIVVIGCNYLCGHVTSFVKYLFLIDSPSPFRSCFTAISELLFYLSYLTPFFIYFAFNRVFRSYAFGLKVEVSQGQTRATKTINQTNV
jgi:hypothetical protein